MPDQIGRYWKDIKDTLSYNLIPTAELTEEGMTNILNNLMLGGMQAWVAIEGESIKALVVTQVVNEIGTGTNNLLIYSLYGYSFIDPKTWQEGIETLRAFARGKDCVNIIGYTKVGRIVDIVKQLGGDTSMTLIKLEV